MTFKANKFDKNNPNHTRLCTETFGTRLVNQLPNGGREASFFERHKNNPEVSDMFVDYTKQAFSRGFVTLNPIDLIAVMAWDIDPADRGKLKMDYHVKCVYGKYANYMLLNTTDPVYSFSLRPGEGKLMELQDSKPFDLWEWNSIIVNAGAS